MSGYVSIEDGDPQTDSEMYAMPMPSIRQIWNGYQISSALWKAGKVAIKHPSAGFAGIQLYFMGMQWAADHHQGALTSAMSQGVATPEFINAQVWGV